MRVEFDRAAALKQIDGVAGEGASLGGSSKAAHGCSAR
jgi:hypothetical protein